jgi:hypothetical protein
LAWAGSRKYLPVLVMRLRHPVPPTSILLFQLAKQFWCRRSGLGQA